MECCLFYSLSFHIQTIWLDGLIQLFTFAVYGLIPSIAYVPSFHYLSMRASARAYVCVCVDVCR